MPFSVGHRGTSCCAVPLDATGVTRSHIMGMGTLPLCWGSLAFDDVFVPSTHLVGEPGRGFQGVSFPLAEHATELEAARWLCYRALWLRSVGKPHTDLAAMAKWWPPKIAKEAIETAWVTHGNLGYSTEMPLQQRYRDVAGYLVADGTTSIQKRIIATTMMGPSAAL